MGLAAAVPAIVWVTVAFAVGIIAAEGGAFPAWVPAVGLAAAGGAWLLGVALDRLGVAAVAAAGCFAALGAGHASLLAQRQPLWSHSADGRTVQAVGFIHAPPEAVAGGWRAVLRVTGLRVGPPAQPRGRRPPGGRHHGAGGLSSSGDHAPLAPANGLVRLTSRGPPPALSVGDQVRATGVYRMGRPGGNPGERSERDALRRRGLEGVLRADPAGGVVVMRPGRWSVRGAVAALRLRLVDGILRALPQPHSGLLLSLLLGIDTHLAPGLYRQFSRAGLVHLMVVSGAQVAIVAGACLWAARLGRLGVVPSALVAGVAVSAFAALVGWAPSIGRALIMSGAGLLAAILGRERDPSATLAAAGLVLLVAHPPAVFDIGFQLSFAATWGLLFVSPALQRHLAPLGRVASAALAAPLGAQIAVAPLLAAHFQTVALAGLVANILVLPVIAALVPAGFVLLPLVAFLPAVGQPLLQVMRPGLDLVLWIGARFGDLPWSVIPTPPVPPWAAAGAFVLMGGAVALLAGVWQPSRTQRTAWAAVAVLAIVAWYAAVTRPPAHLILTALDVGQGDAILIRSPSGRNALVDGGGEVGAAWDVGLMRVVPALRRAGVRRLDLVVLTHPHEDHVGGLPAVVENFPVGLVLDPGVPHPAPSYLRLLSVVEARRIPYRKARAGVVVDMGAGVTLAVLYPPEPIPQVAGDPVHAGSVVLRLTFGRTAALLTGDIEQPAEAWLLDHGAPLASGILKVAHHGSRTSSSPEFVSRVGPAAAVISVGAGNVFGHPHPVTLETLMRAGAAIYRTDEHGGVRLASDGERWRVEPVRRRQDARVH